MLSRRSWGFGLHIALGFRVKGVNVLDAPNSKSSEVQLLQSLEWSEVLGPKAQKALEGESRSVGSNTFNLEGRRQASMSVRTVISVSLKIYAIRRLI